MKKSDNFLSDFLFFCRCCSTGNGRAEKAERAGKNGEEWEEWEEWEGMSSKLVLASHSRLKLFLISS